MIVVAVLALIVVYTNFSSIISIFPISFNDVEYSIITEKEQYILGETVLIKFSTINPTNHDIRIPSLTSLGFRWSMNGVLNPKGVIASITPISLTNILPPTNMSELYDFNNSEKIRNKITPNETGNLTIFYTPRHSSGIRTITKTVEIYPRVYDYNELNISIITDKEEYQLGETVFYSLKIGNPHNSTIRVIPPNTIDTFLELDGLPVDSKGNAISWTVNYFDLEPMSELVLFSFTDGNSITPTRPYPLNITQVLNGGEYVVSKFVNIRYEHNEWDGYSVSELKIEETNVSLGDKVTFSFILHSLLPYVESFHPVPRVDAPDGGYEFLMAERVEAYDDKLVVLMIHPETVGVYTITLGDMRVNFTVS